MHWLTSLEPIYLFKSDDVVPFSTVFQQVNPCTGWLGISHLEGGENPMITISHFRLSTCRAREFFRDGKNWLGSGLVNHRPPVTALVNAREMRMMHVFVVVVGVTRKSEKSKQDNQATDHKQWPTHQSDFRRYDALVVDALQRQAIENLWLWQSRRRSSLRQ